VTPRARRRAEELGVDPSRLEGTGPDGAVTADDVERAAAAARPPEESDPKLRMRRAIAAAMERSNREIPHYWVATSIDLSRATAWLEETNRARGVDRRLVMGSLLFKAAAVALRGAPELNGAWTERGFAPAEHVHLGVAVSLRGGGLVAPAIHDADRLDLDATMAALADVVARARSGRLRSSEMSDATCTVTSLGERGVETVIPRIAPPQVAMIGFGRVARRPWVVDDRVEARPIVEATLAGDHRATDGHRGAAFLASLDALLQRPEAL
jgi:pyruvate dehydrogenase E2 component (dihydrolipoamide acetyltransferase)